MSPPLSFLHLSLSHTHAHAHTHTHTHNTHKHTFSVLSFVLSTPPLSHFFSLSLPPPSPSHSYFFPPLSHSSLFLNLTPLLTSRLTLSSISLSFPQSASYQAPKVIVTSVQIRLAAFKLYFTNLALQRISCHLLAFFKKTII